MSNTYYEQACAKLDRELKGAKLNMKAAAVKDSVIKVLPTLLASIVGEVSLSTHTERQWPLVRWVKNVKCRPKSIWRN